MHGTPNEQPTWLAPTDTQALSDFAAVFHDWAAHTARAGAPDERAVSNPRDVRAGLEEAIGNQGWSAYEAAIRAHARRCAEARLPYGEVERAYSRLLGELAPRLVAAYADSPRRQVAAVDVLARLVRFELGVLARGFRSPLEPVAQSEPNFGPALDILGDGVIATDRDGRVTSMNLKAQQLVGWTLEDARGQRLDEVFHLVDQETGEGVPSRVNEVLQEDRVVNRPQPPALVARDGSTPCAVVDSIAPIHDEDGSIQGAVLVFRDPNHDRQHNEALEASEARTAAIFEASLDGVVTIDQEGVLLEFNSAASKMFGFGDGEEAFGRSFAELVVPEESLHAYEKALGEDLTQSDGPKLIGLRQEIVLRRLDGTRFYAELAVSRIPEAGGWSYTCFVRDLTKAKLAEEQLRKSSRQLRALAGRVEAAREEERTRIARELHDELGQQLTAIRMDLGWLVRRQKALPPEIAERVTAISGLIDGTFKVVRRLATELRPGILDDLGLAVAIEWQAREFQNRSGVEVAVDATTEVESLDPRHATTIFRIFQEILTNVGRHSGATRVEARLWREGEQLRFEVADNGRGIRPEEAANANSLGLLGMRERATLLGGTFVIAPGPHEGTVVSVSLPTQDTSHGK